MFCYNDLMVKHGSKRISTAPTRRIAEKHGIDNPFAFARETGIAYTTARRWFLDEGLGTIRIDTLIQLAVYFDVQPGDLFEMVDAIAEK